MSMSFDPEPERAEDLESWRGTKQADGEDRDADIRAAVEAERERIAVAIEDHGKNRDHSDTDVDYYGGLLDAARIARSDVA